MPQQKTEMELPSSRELSNDLTVLRLSLNGSDWQIQETPSATQRRLFPSEGNADGWVPSHVPGNIHSDLEEAHLLTPLRYGNGDPRLVEVAQRDWLYRKDFWVPSKFEARRVKLVFEGVDHACDVWLNGELLGSHAGMFQSFGFDVANVIKRGALNQLTLRIERMPEALQDILVASDGKMSGGEGSERGPNFFLNGINQMRQLLQYPKSPTNFGWDWGVNIYTIGIWKNVWLEMTGASRIEWMQVLSDVTDIPRRAEIRVSLGVNSLDASRVKATFIVQGQGVEVEELVECELRPGDNKLETKLTLDEPALWWCNGQGAQPLYEASVRLADADTGKVSDARSTRFGIRTVKWEQVEGAPSDFINPYQLSLNGRPIRTMGSNLIPPDLLFGRMNEKGLRLVQLAHAAGMNTLRVWGGGALLTNEMYDLADELGIMLIQEFPLANCIPEADAVFLEKLGATVLDLVSRFRNHPSIIEWGGGNEMDWKQGDGYPALRLMERIVADNDNRIFRASDPIQGSRHSPWHYDPETHYAHFNNENLTDNLRSAPLMRYGEFGTQTPANLEVWQREIPVSDVKALDNLDNPILVRKNIVQAVFSERFWLLKSTIDTLFGPSASLAELIEAGQFLAAEGLRYAVDALRRRGKHLGGFTTWDLNEPWTNGAGSYLVDYDGRPLMNYGFVKEALTPVSLSLQYDSILYNPATGIDVELTLVSDAPSRQEALSWAWLARDLTGVVFANGAGSASIEPREVLRLGQINLKPPEPSRQAPFLVELELRDADGGLLTERVHIFGAAGISAPFAGLIAHGGAAGQTFFSGYRTTLQPKYQCRTERGQEFLELELTNTGAATALFCEPHPLLEYRTDYDAESNHIFIPPRESRRITLRAPIAASPTLTLAQTGWRISCWNADDVLVSPEDSVVLSVGRRDAMAREFSDARHSPESAQDMQRGNRPDSSTISMLLCEDSQPIRFLFDAALKQTKRPVILRLHTADQSDQAPTIVEVTLNGRSNTRTFSVGLGIHRTEPAQLAFPETAVYEFDADTLLAGENILQVRVKQGWFSWDALDLVVR